MPGSTALAGVVAANLYTLRAYKDEYEVARLSLDPALVEEYRALVAELLADLDAGSHAGAVETAGPADMVRGYEQIKLDSVPRYRAALRERRTRP